MQRTLVATVVIALFALSAGASWAQMGTPNLPSATPWQGADAYRAEGRFFQEDNQTWGVFFRGANGERADGMFGYFDWETTGEDPIGGAVRQSDYEAVVIDLKWLLYEGSPAVAVRGGADLPLGNPRGTNLSTTSAALGSGPIPVVSVPVEFGIVGDATVVVEPKYIWFDDPLSVVGGGSVEGWGEVFMLGAGVRWPISERTDVVADAAYPLSGTNSIDEVTNEVTEALAWSAGISHMIGGSGDWQIDLFATTAAGPTPATSSIATPDQSVGGGVSVSGTW